MLHYLSTAMARSGWDRIGAEWPAEVDETYVGEATQGEEARAAPQTLVIGIVEVRSRRKAPWFDPNLPTGQRPQYRGGQERGFIAGRLRPQVIQNRTQGTLEPVVMGHLATGDRGEDGRVDRVQQLAQAGLPVQCCIGPR